VTEETGINPCPYPNQAVRDLAEAMTLWIRILSYGFVQERQDKESEVYDWKAMGLILTQLYREILEADKGLA